MLYYSLGICILSLLILGFLLIAVWNRRLKTDIGTYRRLRSFAAFLTSVHAVVSIYRLSVEIAIPRTLEKPFVPELLGYLVFWVLVPRCGSSLSISRWLAMQLQGTIVLSKILNV